MSCRGIAGVAAIAAVAFGVSFTAQAADTMTHTITLEYKIVDDTMPRSLTGVPGDPVNGRKVAINRKQGNCLACHKMPVPEEQFHGEISPNLAGVGSRYTEAELRMRLVDPKVLNPDTMMPSFYKTAGFTRVRKNFRGKSILSAQQVEDVVAYLLTLKEE
jgi:sulfur-oxidizing protein SoxX